jgi:hypothetical protein
VCALPRAGPPTGARRASPSSRPRPPRALLKNKIITECIHFMKDSSEMKKVCLKKKIRDEKAYRSNFIACRNKSLLFVADAMMEEAFASREGLCLAWHNTSNVTK